MSGKMIFILFFILFVWGCSKDKTTEIGNISIIKDVLRHEFFGLSFISDDKIALLLRFDNHGEKTFEVHCLDLLGNTLSTAEIRKGVHECILAGTTRDGKLLLNYGLNESIVIGDNKSFTIFEEGQFLPAWLGYNTSCIGGCCAFTTGVSVEDTACSICGKAHAVRFATNLSSGERIRKLGIAPQHDLKGVIVGWKDCTRIVWFDGERGVLRDEKGETVFPKANELPKFSNDYVFTLSPDSSSIAIYSNKPSKAIDVLIYCLESGELISDTNFEKPSEEATLFLKWSPDSVKLFVALSPERFGWGSSAFILKKSGDILEVLLKDNRVSMIDPGVSWSSKSEYLALMLENSDKLSVGILEMKKD